MAAIINNFFILPINSSFAIDDVHDLTKACVFLSTCGIIVHTVNVEENHLTTTGQVVVTGTNHQSVLLVHKLLTLIGENTIVGTVVEVELHLRDGLITTHSCRYLLGLERT